jgi:DNA-dependent RNA polymerase
MDTYRGDTVDAIDTEGASRERYAKTPFTESVGGRETLKLWIGPLADYIARKRRPRGLETVIRRLTSKQLAFMALRSVLDQIHAGWDRRGKKPKRRLKKIKNPDMRFRLELGRAARDELEFAGLLKDDKKCVRKAGRRSNRAKYAVLAKFRDRDWSDKECALIGDWLWDCLAEMDCFDIDERGFPKIADNHKAALDAFAEEHVFDHPLYKPSLLEPAAWTSYRTEYPGEHRISSTFVKANDPETVQTIKAAIANGSIEPHARGVSAVQSVPLRINAVTLPLLKEFGGEKFNRETVVAEALVDKPQFWLPIRCDFRGRLVHQCDFNYTRGDEVRSLFLFAAEKPIKQSIAWLEIAIASAYGIKGTWTERLTWVAERRELIKVCAVDRGLIWRGNGIKPKEPYQFAAACREYVEADTHGEAYPTHLPIWLDASSNGLQHLAMMRRDPKLARMVNLNTKLDSDVQVYEFSDGSFQTVMYSMDVALREIPLTPDAAEWASKKEDRLQDAYKLVAHRVHTNLFADRFDPLSQFWLDQKKHLRNFCKTR